MNDWLARDRNWCVAFVAALILAGAMRVIGLGHWSFASDELGTFNDLRMFHGDTVLAEDDPDRNVPKMIPLAMLLHSTANGIFGSDELGSRTLPAFCGWLQIAIAGWIVGRLLGRTTGLALIVLLAMSPDHLFYSQYHRFYTPTALFASASMLLAALGIRNGSTATLVVAIVSAFLAVLTHTLAGMLFGGMIVGVFLARRHAPNGKRLLLVALAGAAIAMAFAVLYLYPLGKGKSVGYVWEGYSATQSIFSGVIQVTWPVALLSLPGLVMLWRKDRGQALFWGTQAAVWACSLVVLPRVLSFHPAYVFAVCLPVFVLASVAVSEVVNRFNRPAGVLLFAVFLVLNLPATLSYFSDGNRQDFRAASRELASRAGPDDVVLTVQGDKLEHYAPEFAGRWHMLPRKDVPAFVEAHRSKTAKTWLFLPGGRGGLPEPWRKWAEQNARIQATIVHRRFDYHEFPVFILLLNDPGSPPPGPPPR